MPTDVAMWSQLGEKPAFLQPSTDIYVGQPEYKPLRDRYPQLHSSRKPAPKPVPKFTLSGKGVSPSSVIVGTP